MAWRDRLQPASFRGVRFQVESTENETGRRVVVHEYPFRDEVYVEDMGRAVRRYSFDAYLIGADYLDSAEALMRALEAGGPGELVHPYIGTRRVAVQTIRRRELRDEGGMVRFGLQFVETGEALYPSAATDTRAAIESAAAAVTERAETSFLDRFSVQGRPQFVTSSAAAVMQGKVQALRDALGPLQAAIDASASINRDLDSMYLSADALVRTPGQMARELVTQIRAIAALPVSPQRLVSTLRGIYGVDRDRPPIPTTTATRIQEAANAVALDDLFDVAVVAEAARLAPTANWESYEQAVVARDSLADPLDELMEATADDDLYSDLRALRAALVQSVPGPDNDLSRLIRVTPLVTVPSLALTYRLYGDLALEADIVARNRIRHPGFVRGGVAVEVLTRG